MHLNFFLYCLFCDPENFTTLAKNKRVSGFFAVGMLFFNRGNGNQIKTLFSDLKKYLKCKPTKISLPVVVVELFFFFLFFF